MVEATVSTQKSSGALSFPSSSVLPQLWLPLALCGTLPLCVPKPANRTELVVAEAEVRLKFDGLAVAGGQMNARRLAQSLIGVSDLVTCRWKRSEFSCS